MSKEVASYGSWISPVTAQSYAGRSVTLTQLRMDGPDIYWVEGSPRREGRKVLLRRNALGQTGEVLPLLEGSRLVHVATRVHEFGGRAYAIKNGRIVVSNGTDDRVYYFDTRTLRAQLVPLTQLDKCRYGDFEIDEARGVVYAVCEDHTDPDHVQHSLVAIPLDGSGARDTSKIRTICDQTDFVSSPTLSPDGSKLAWVTWNRPELPWTKSELRVAAMNAAGEPFKQVTLVDRPDVAVTEPRWTFAGDLIHIDDSSGHANLYRTEGFTTNDGEPQDAWATRLRTRVLHPGPRSFTTPRWHLGLHSFDVLDNDHLICSWAEDSQWHLGTIQLSNGLMEEWDTGWWPIGNVAASEGRVVFVGDSSTHYPAIVRVDNAAVKVVRTSNEAEIDQDYNSRAEHVTWTARDGLKVHGFYYPPNNPQFTGPEDELPPLITMVHSGPANAALPGLSLAKQYWTTRGFAVLDVNYRGSTALGRKYRESLNGQFGVAEVADIVDGVNWLAEQKLIDSKRVAIAGSGTGGFTVMAALESTEVFSAGTSRYGYLDLRRTLTHAPIVDADYLRRLMDSSDSSDPVWAERSPINQLARVNAPVLLMGGANDPIVTPDEIEEVYQKLVDSGKEVAKVIFDNEGHGFVRADTLESAWRTELAFYADIWGIELQHPVPVEIANRGSRPVVNPV
ncbi:prolyl oligopeptidase family serine peptidase [Scrofimicrobium sp. R131]|uniref:Prolyl oligopeptidase family serine peptidase n=1 Tax=Scrofimicrobium appendicitidis TaxID=3079930 RepID=A0AAU7V743_9ACTO